MAGNFLSRALLSLFMDKSAREKFDAIQDHKRGARTGAAPAPEAAPEPEASDDDVLPETLISRAIEAASQELERKKNLPPGRQALIEQALSIHDEKSKMLDDLPREQREKLTVMALYAFGEAAKEKKAGKAGPKKRKKT